MFRGVVHELDEGQNLIRLQLRLTSLEAALHDRLERVESDGSRHDSLSKPCNDLLQRQ
jgi:predicted nucleotide-binding protein (sugar kinase/HSP70/actin superfamily)